MSNQFCDWSSPAQETLKSAGPNGSSEAKSAAICGPVTARRSTITRGLRRRAAATHSAFKRLIKSTSPASLGSTGADGGR